MSAHKLGMESPSSASGSINMGNGRVIICFKSNNNNRKKKRKKNKHTTTIDGNQYGENLCVTKVITTIDRKNERTNEAHKYTYMWGGKRKNSAKSHGFVFFRAFKTKASQPASSISFHFEARVIMLATIPALRHVIGGA